MPFVAAADMPREGDRGALLLPGYEGIPPEGETPLLLLALEAAERVGRWSVG